MKICPICGTQTEDKAFFCPNCQADLPAATIAAQAPPQQPPQPPLPAQPQPYDPTGGGAQPDGDVPPFPPAPMPPAGVTGGYGAAPLPPQQPSAPGQSYAASQYESGYPGQQPFPPGYEYHVPITWDSDGMPMGASKFAWGALFFGWIWCAVYGLWGFLAIDLGISVVSGILNAFSDNEVANALSGALGFGALGWRVALGFIGPKTFWKQSPDRYTIERWNRHQRNWGIAAIVYIAVVCLCAILAFSLIATAVSQYAPSL